MQSAVTHTGSSRPLHVRHFQYHFTIVLELQQALNQSSQFGTRVSLSMTAYFEKSLSEWLPVTGCDCNTKEEHGRAAKIYHFVDGTTGGRWVLTIAKPPADFSTPLRCL